MAKFIEREVFKFVLDGVLFSIEDIGCFLKVSFEENGEMF